MNTIFVDMDGVLADFEGDYLRRFGHACENAPSKKEMWNNVKSVDRMFANLPILPGAIGGWYGIKALADKNGLDVVILTSGGSSNYEEIARQKKEWIRDNIDFEVRVIPVYDSKHKKLFVQREGDILIDDYDRNIEEWEAEGGVPIHHTGDWNATLMALEDILW